MRLSESGNSGLFTLIVQQAKGALLRNLAFFSCHKMAAAAPRKNALIIPFIFCISDALTSGCLMTLEKLFLPRASQFLEVVNDLPRSMLFLYKAMQSPQP